MIKTSTAAHAVKEEPGMTMNEHELADDAGHWDEGLHDGEASDDERRKRRKVEHHRANEFGVDEAQEEKVHAGRELDDGHVDEEQADDEIPAAPIKIRLLPSRGRRHRSRSPSGNDGIHDDPNISRPSPRWQPSRYLEPSKPPPDEAIKLQQYEVALKAAEGWNGGVDFAGRAPKLLKPRRTVDYMAEVGRMRIVSCSSLSVSKLRRG